MDPDYLEGQPIKDLHEADPSSPFAVRQGKALSWRGVSMKVSIKKGQDKVILNNVWGEVPEKTTTAILGPSGAGKTSLLTVLSGRNVTGGSVKVNAVVRLEDRKVDPCNIEVRKQIAYVAQEDSLMVSQTPRDAIRFSAKLRLSKTMTEDDLDVLTNTMLKELGLDSCADTLVGGAMLKGISGGERKRTSVGVELVTKPTLVFLDEPTSGLDSFSATQVCSVLRKVADSGASVLLTIHQPSSDIFQTFDLLILMNKGRIMYQGKVEDVDQYFEVRHHPLPPKFNPADHIMLVAQTVPEDELVAQGFFEEDPRPALEEKENCPTESVARNEDRVGFAVQLKLLVKRELMSLKRNKIVLGYRLFLTSFSVTLMGIIFWRVGDTDSSNPANLQSHLGAQMMILMNCLLGTALPTLMMFPQERPVMIREYSTNHYGIFAYFFSRLFMEALLSGIQMLVLCVLSYFMIGFQTRFGWYILIVYCLAMASSALSNLVGSAVKDPSHAIEFLPLAFLPQVLFSGFFVRPDLIPIWLRWLQYCFPLTYALKLAVYYEYRVCNPGQQQCNLLLEGFNVTADRVWFYWLMLAVLFVVLRTVALVTLTIRARKE